MFQVESFRLSNLKHATFNFKILIVMKRVLSIAILIVVSWFAQAHEFWLHPNKFVYEIGEKAEVRLLVGESFTGGAWDLTGHKI